MADDVETLKIRNPKNPSEMAIINASDYDPEKHQLWEEPSTTMASTGGATPPAPSIPRPAGAEATPQPEEGGEEEPHRRSRR